MRISVKLKLGAAFGLVIALTAAVGGVATSKLSVLNETVDRILEERVAALQLSKDAETSVLQSISAEKSAILASSDDDNRKFIGLAKEASQRTLKTIAEANGTVSPGVKPYFEKLAKLVEENAAIQPMIFDKTVLNSESKAYGLVAATGRQAFSDTFIGLTNVIATMNMSRTSWGPEETAAVGKLRDGLVWV